MRDIRFRGKRTDADEWVEGDLIHGQGPMYRQMFILPQQHIYPKGCSNLNGWNVDPSTVGQFIGKKDKNENEIWEGDIAKQPLSFASYEFYAPYYPTGHDGYGYIDCIGTIIFKESSFFFRCDKVLKETSPWHDKYNLTRHFLNRCYSIENCKIIGNIHDNPELFNAQNDGGIKRMA